MKKYRIFVLGAGFSKPAGLPLCADLFTEILSLAKKNHLYGQIKEDIEAFLSYRKRTRNASISEEQINFEEFISYLDMEHFLQLKGSDHWSSEGNLTQLYIKNLIALVLHNKETAMTDDKFTLYERFAERLEPGDVILTFNYDTILEKTFNRKNIAYRLFPIRYKNVHYWGGEVAESDEIVLLKMHGSINWFDVSPFDAMQEDYKTLGMQMRLKHEVFAEQKEPFPLKRIINGPYPKESSLHRIYATSEIEKYLRNTTYYKTAPLLISPSYNKIVYLNIFAEFWRGFNMMGIENGSLIIIGFSLAEHDEYLQQPLYHLIDNFQNNNYWGEILRKNKLRIVDYKRDQTDIETFKKRYKFIDWSRTKSYFEGFDLKSLDVIFGED